MSLILLGGVVATPGRTPEAATTTDVGFVADNASAKVVPNADFLRGRAKVLGMLEESVSQLRSNGAPFSSAAADRLGAIAQRLAMASPSDPDQLEAIVADLSREANRKLAARQGDPNPYLRLQHARRPGRIAPPPEVIALLGDIVAALRDLIRGLFPPPPYIPGYAPVPHAASRALGSTQQRLLMGEQPLLAHPVRPGAGTADYISSQLATKK